MLPLPDIDTTFSAYQRKNAEKEKADDLDDELKKPKELTIVDSRRSARGIRVCLIILGPRTALFCCPSLRFPTVRFVTLFLAWMR